ncbi:sulfotransferase family protein [Burkholderia sp. WSM2230]|uniref:sulfotransferase family protein n=1 Tax=Burkholderia sp. WSM2230 TaxID=944435 RepID=UPI00041DE374|nr:sulfotransferase [Burkholderia sp. WSM2230]
MEYPQAEELFWLVVGGAPRSGTTALGAALNQSGAVALFHEYASKKLFDALDVLFSEEARMRAFADFDNFAHLMPVRSRDEQAIVRSVFRAVFGKEARFFGTKFPGHHAWPQPNYPQWLGLKEIHITRDPFDVVLSMLKKDHGESVRPEDVENALFGWIHAWNYAVGRHGAGDFLNVFYDDLVLDNARWQQSISGFLGGIDDFSLASFRKVSELPVHDKFARANMSEHLPFIESIAEVNGWASGASASLEAGRKIGFPLRTDQAIDLRNTGNGSRYIDHGFYPAERDGAWTRGTLNDVLFTPTEDYEGALAMALDIVWVAELHGKGRDVMISLDDRTVFHSRLSLGQRNGTGMTLSVVVPDMRLQPRRAISLKIQVLDPVNPCREGLSGDDRELGAMVRSITFSRL